MTKISTRFTIMDEIKLLSSTLPAEILKSLTSPSSSPAKSSTLTQLIDSPPNIDTLMNKKEEIRSSNNVIPTKIVTTEEALDNNTLISELKPAQSCDITIKNIDNLVDIKNITSEIKEITSPWQVINSSPKKSLLEIQAEETAMAKANQKQITKPQQKQIKEKSKPPIINNSSSSSHNGEENPLRRSNENPWGIIPQSNNNKPPYIATILSEQKTADKNFKNKRHEQPKVKSKEIIPIIQDKPTTVTDLPYWNFSKPETINTKKKTMKEILEEEKQTKERPTKKSEKVKSLKEIQEEEQLFKELEGSYGTEVAKWLLETK